MFECPRDDGGGRLNELRGSGCALGAIEELRLAGPVEKRRDQAWIGLAERAEKVIELLDGGSWPGADGATGHGGC
jgi:hypothetical protein